MCEKQGYIERFYVDQPNDKVDLTIQDMQRYTKTLIEEETNLAVMVEKALRENAKEDEDSKINDELDVIDEEDCITVECEPNEVGIVAEKLEQAGLKVESSENTLVPDNYIDLDEKQLASFTKMLELLEDNDDVQEVVHNANLPEEEIDEQMFLTKQVKSEGQGVSSKRTKGCLSETRKTKGVFYRKHEKND